MRNLLLAIVLALTAAGNAQTIQREQVQLNSNNTVVWRGEIDFASALEVQLKLAALSAKRATSAYRYPIYLVMDSPGGSLDVGLSFIQFAKTIKELHTISIFAASMASGVVEALPGRRLVTEDGMLMFHRARAQLSGQVETGELESRLAMVKRTVLKLEQANANRMGLSLADYKAKVINELWLDSDEALANKAADKIVDLVCSDELIKSRSTEVFFTFFGPVELKYSGCPLFRAPTR